MSATSIDSSSAARKPLRLLPAVILVIVQWFLWIGIQYILPHAMVWGALGGVGLGLVILLWWLFFSRAPWSERIGALVLMVGAVAVTRFIVDPSIRGGMMGLMVV